MSSAEPNSAPPQVVIQQKESLFGRFGKLLVAALVVCIVMLIGMRTAYDSYFNPPGGPQEKFHSLSKSASKKIAIIDISGTIFESDDFTERQIDRVRKDEHVVAVVLRINSPGGTVTYSDLLHHKLRQLATGASREGAGEGQPLPMVVSMGSVCASGGYLLATAVGDSDPNTIFAEPSTITGSIGVMIPHYDLSGLLDAWNVKDDSVVSHELKDMGSLTKTMTEEERKIFQNMVDEMLADFKDKVKAARPVLRDNPADLDAVATGQIFTAKQAVELKLVDKIGYLDAAIERAAELAKQDPDSLRCVRYKRQPGPLDALLGTSSQSQRRELRIDASSLLELATPRAYYLCSWLPAIIESGR